MQFKALLFALAASTVTALPAMFGPAPTSTDFPSFPAPTTTGIPSPPMPTGTGYPTTSPYPNAPYPTGTGAFGAMPTEEVKVWQKATLKPSQPTAVPVFQAANVADAAKKAPWFAIF